MNYKGNLILFAVICVILIKCARCEYALNENEESEVTQELGRELVEQGICLKLKIKIFLCHQQF